MRGTIQPKIPIMKKLPKGSNKNTGHTRILRTTEADPQDSLEDMPHAHCETGKNTAMTAIA